MKIGPSNGWLYVNGKYSPAEQEDFVRKAGANALEINIYYRDPGRVPYLTGDERFSGFDYLALHMRDYHDGWDMENELALTKKIIDKQGVVATVIHPTGIPEKCWADMFCNIPVHFSIENTDEDCPIKELERLMKAYGLNLVLDVQHAYEHDPTMGYARELLDMALGMGMERLLYIHVSGETDDDDPVVSMHSLVHKAKNANEIIDFTGQMLSKKQVPVILEGSYRTPEELEKEIKFLTGELNL